MTNNKYDNGTYILTTVTMHGLSKKKTYTSWAKCRTDYAAAMRDSVTRYAVIIDASDGDTQYWHVREEYHVVFKPNAHEL